jgi:hypothetical protein
LLCETGKIPAPNPTNGRRMHPEGIITVSKRIDLETETDAIFSPSPNIQT